MSALGMDQRYGSDAYLLSLILSVYLSGHPSIFLSARAFGHYCMISTLLGAVENREAQDIVFAPKELQSSWEDKTCTIREQYRRVCN